MTYIGPEASIVVSFLGFLLLFAKKIYPFIVEQLDRYINSIKEQIYRSESQKDEAYALLKIAYEKKDKVEETIKLNRVKSKEKIKRLSEENAAHLNLLKENHEISINKQLDAELTKQKNLLINRLSDSIIENLTNEIIADRSKFKISVNKSDLCKLLRNPR